MKSSFMLLTAAASTVMGHGFVKEFIIGGQSYPGSDPFNEEYNDPARITQPFFSNKDSPIIYLNNDEVTCNRGAKPAKLVAKAPAGSKIVFKWSKWFDDHKGPIITYLADCGGDCTKAKGPDLNWFKVDEAGLINGVWATDILMKQDKTWTIQLPKKIKNGQYLMRHEMIALHLADKPNGAQFYPSCSNIEITGGTGEASPPTVKFPSAYQTNDPSILLSIKGINSYRIPGPACYTESDSVLSDKLNGSGAGSNPGNSQDQTYGNPYPSQPSQGSNNNNNYGNNPYQTKPSATTTPSYSNPKPTQSSSNNSGSQAGTRKVCDDAYVKCASAARDQKSSGSTTKDTASNGSYNYKDTSSSSSSGSYDSKDSSSSSQPSYKNYANYNSYGNYNKARRSPVQARAQAYADYSQEPCYKTWETCLNKLPTAARYSQ
ncbi:hypothetical protein H072_5441 [Dactylellina haptotyla CBS 200.50]|uniref:lytic cellulose monooxygenase (C4-dehydrogenating) n=1 Tax=Dactylellina haptotyla (strain CBS 200.50) TaxID=1284197 RepID=S8BZ82_DACHA|nr:hypothetical protein H072_5441 [Dactylellina haptotyla CBS 200.50]